MRRSRLIVGLGSVALALGLYTLRPVPPNLQTHEAREDFAGARSPAGVSPQLSRSGLGHAYRFTRSMIAHLGGGSKVDLRLQGSLMVRGQGAQATEAVVRIDQVASQDGTLSSLPTIRFNLISGAAESTLERSDVSGAAVRFARDILDQYRFFEKSDLQGDYEAAISQDDSTHYDKSKTRYLSEPYSSARIPLSKHHLSLAKDGWPATIEGSEEIRLGDSQIAVRTEGRYRIEAADDRTISELEGALAQRSWHAAGLDAAPDTPGNRWTAASMEGVPSLETLIARLRSGSLKSAAERMEWFRQMVKRLDTTAGRIEPIRALIPELKASPEQFNLLAGAMAASTQSDIAATLLETYRDESYPNTERTLVMNAWIATDAPLSSDTTAYLSSVVADASAPRSQVQSALLALGAQARKTDNAREIESLLIAQLKKAGSDLETQAALDAIGNAGDSTLLPYIQDFLTSQSEHVRAHAYMALRFVPGNQVTALLQAGTADASPEVQRSVALSLELREAAG